ncbi:MAG: AI-2E family transporter [Tissierellaceae bacterium]|nr:AI-2E family transporter [Tissierellaceae bacterium]
MRNRDDLKRIYRDTKKGIKGYFIAQLVLMIMTFLIFSIGLVIVDVNSPLLIAFIIAVLDILPVLGSGIIMIPWVIFSLIAGNSQRALGLAIVYVVGTLIRQIIEPKITGDKIGIRPIYTFVATILGSIIFGPIGIILGPIIAVVIKSILDINKNN